MKKFTINKFRHLWLSVLLCLGVSVAWADDITSAAELKTAIEGLTEDNQSITLGTKITLTENITASKSFTLNLGTYSITKGSYSIDLADDVTVTTSKSATIFSTAVEGKQVCYKRLESGYSYHVAAAVAKNTYFFETVEDAITYYATSTSQTTITLLQNASLSSDVVAPGIATASALYIKQGDYTLTANNHKIYLRRDVIGGTDKEVTNLFAASEEDTGCTLNTLAGTATYPYRYQPLYSKEAKIGETEYETFAAAANAANADDVVVLMRNIADSYTLSEGKTLKVQKSGYTIGETPHNYTVTVNAPTGENLLYSSIDGGVTTYYLDTPTIEYTGTNDQVSKMIDFDSQLKAGTYKLLKDVSRARLPISANNSTITIDLNGHTFTSTESNSWSAFNINKTGVTLSIVDTSTDGGGKIVQGNASAAVAFNSTNGTLTVGEKVTIEGCIALFNSGNTLNVSGTINGGDYFAVVTNGSTVVLLTSTKEQF